MAAPDAPAGQLASNDHFAPSCGHELHHTAGSCLDMPHSALPACTKCTLCCVCQHIISRAGTIMRSEPGITQYSSTTLEASMRLRTKKDQRLFSQVHVY